MLNLPKIARITRPAMLPGEANARHLSYSPVAYCKRDRHKSTHIIASRIHMFILALSTRTKGFGWNQFSCMRMSTTYKSDSDRLPYTMSERQSQQPTLLIYTYPDAIINSPRFTLFTVIYTFSVTKAYYTGKHEKLQGKPGEGYSPQMTIWAYAAL